MLNLPPKATSGKHRMNPAAECLIRTRRRYV